MSDKLSDSIFKQPGDLARITSPRLRGEVGSPRRCEASSGAIRVRGCRSIDWHLTRGERPLTPTLSPQERGEGEENAASHSRDADSARALRKHVPREKREQGKPGARSTRSPCALVVSTR